jgi:DnaJ family protein A protein 5
MNASKPQIAHNVESDAASASASDDDEYADRAAIEARLNGLTSTSASTRSETPATTATLDTLPDDPTKSDSTAPKLGKAAQKRAKRAAKQAEATSSVNPETPHKCAGCDAGFASKNGLFQHLEDHPKHAALKNVAGKGKKKGRK